MNVNIDDLTLGQLKQIAQMVGETTQGQQPATTTHIGKKCIIRTYASGVHFGTLISRNGRMVELQNARRLWGWNTGGEGISLSEVATTGISQSKSKICCVVPEMTILDALEIIPCSNGAINSIESAKVAKP